MVWISQTVSLLILSLAIQAGVKKSELGGGAKKIYFCAAPLLFITLNQCSSVSSPGIFRCLVWKESVRDDSVVNEG